VAPPPTTTPGGFLGPIATPAAGSTPAPVAHAEPADLNRAWRGVMTALGQTLPHHLNRAAYISRTMGRATR
jgi:hypothetical protein